MDSRVIIAVLVSFLTMLPLENRSIDAAEEVTVQLESGRSYTGNIDPKTDDITLWMRFESYGKIRVLRPIKWQIVTHVEAGGVEISADVFREQLGKWISASTMTPPWAALANSRDHAHRLNTHPLDFPSSTAERALTAMDFRQRNMVTVMAGARLAQWDNDAQLDGVEVLVTPLDGSGRVLPVRGTVTLELRAPRAVDREQAPRLHGYSFQTVARSSHQISPGDFGPDGVVVRLHFRQYDPQRDLTWLDSGVLHVRLVVPGSGVFRTSVDDLKIRPFSPLRDFSQRIHGRRTLLGE